MKSSFYKPESTKLPNNKYNWECDSHSWKITTRIVVIDNFDRKRHNEPPNYHYRNHYNSKVKSWISATKARKKSLKVNS